MDNQRIASELLKVAQILVGKQSEPKILKFVRLQRIGQDGEVDTKADPVELFHLQHNDTHYLFQFGGPGPGILSYGIQKGSKALIQSKFDSSLDNFIDPVQMSPGSTSLDSHIIKDTKPDTDAKKHLGIIDHELFGTDWDKIKEIEDTSDLEDFNKYLKNQLRIWRGWSYKMPITKHKYWSKFKSMVEAAVKAKYGSRIKLYRGIIGDQAKDIIDGKPLKVHKFSSWSNQKDVAKDYAMLSQKFIKEHWAVVSTEVSASRVLFAEVHLPEYMKQKILMQQVEHGEIVIETPSGIINNFKIVERDRMRRRGRSAKESQKLQLKTLMDTGKKTRKEQDTQKQKYIAKIGRMLRKLIVKGSKARKLVDEVVREFPGRNTGSVATQRKNRWTKLAKQVPEIIKFSEYVGGPKRMYGSALYIVRDVVLGLKKLDVGKADAEKIAGKWFMESTLQEGAKVFEESGYEADFMQYLPPNISFDLSPSREVKSIIEMFGREKKNWETFAKKLAFIAMRFNEIVRQVKKDMKSSDDVKRMCALMTAITIETGLRPGAVGNAANVKDPVTGEKIEIETFGVTTLQRRHVKFVRDNFVEIRFDGKMGGENVAGLSDGDILKELNKAVESTTLDGDTAMLFVTKRGEIVGYTQMKDYVSDKWGMISPTDFRKLKATKVFYSKLKGRSDDMKKEISSLAATGEKKMKKIITDRILEVLQSAAEDAQKELSHENWTTTIKTYVDPRVVVNFLNQGGLDDTLDDILIRNKNVVLTFDFDAFVKAGKVAKPVVVIEDKGESGLSVIDFLDDLDSMVEALTE